MSCVSRRAAEAVFTWSVGVFNLGHLRGDEFGGVLLLAAVRLSLLTLLHLFIVILQIHTHALKNAILFLMSCHVTVVYYDTCQ